MKDVALYTYRMVPMVLVEIVKLLKSQGRPQTLFRTLPFSNSCVLQSIKFWHHGCMSKLQDE
jgi:hypothetical protein